MVLKTIFHRKTEGQGLKPYGKIGFPYYAPTNPNKKNCHLVCRSARVGLFIYAFKALLAPYGVLNKAESFICFVRALNNV